MTNRLYYDNCYLTGFDAVVISCEESDGKYLVYLDRSAFYPTSGGQPYDTGDIAGAEVLDVYVDKNGDVCHVTDRPLSAGSRVHGKIDWNRRFDHMQQHAGEHMLANAVYRLLGGTTIGLHLGAEISTIDVTMPDGETHLSDDTVRMLENDVNERIWRDVAIRQWFPDEAELLALPLRKPPAVNEHVRIVQIGNEEFCACGGTHPSSAGQIGLIKILEARPARGKLRLGFVCGKRAYERLRHEHDILTGLANDLTTSYENVPDAVSSIAQQQKELALSNKRLKTELFERSLDTFVSNARTGINGARIIAEIIDSDIQAAREVANILTDKGYIVLFGIEQGDRYLYIASAPDNSDIQVNEVLSEAAKRCGGKGGGRPGFAQGSGGKEMLNIMLNIAINA